MSNVINNREYRQKVIKELIGELHAGKTVEQVKGKFEEAFRGVAASEIAEAEQALIMEGLPVAEVQRLCDVHAAVFKGSIEQLHRPSDPTETPGHPAHTMKSENRAVKRLISESVRPHLRALETGDAEALPALKRDLELLAQVDVHYAKKENLLFPYLEKYGITAPPKVMWGVDDEIRALIKTAAAALERGGAGEAGAAVEAAVSKVSEMIFKEENILLPMALDTLTQDEWKRIADESGEFGYCLLDGVPEWSPTVAQQPEAADAAPAPGVLKFPTGELKPGEIARMLDTLPFDVTFVDAEGTVKYFSQGKDRIFARTKAVIGRKVVNCHPPASMHIVQKLVSDLMSGKKDHEDFWIKMGDRYVLIRYYAVRGEGGEYLGTLEVTQDIAPIQAIQGEKRLMDS